MKWKSNQDLSRKVTTYVSIEFEKKNTNHKIIETPNDLTWEAAKMLKGISEKEVKVTMTQATKIPRTRVNTSLTWPPNKSALENKRVM